MKRLILFLLFAKLAFAEEEEPTYSIWDYHPIHVGGNLLRIDGAEVSDTPTGGDLYYRKTNAFLYVLVPITRTSYFFPRIEYNTFTLDWNKNPRFKQDHFHYAQFALTFYSTGLDKWKWIARGEYNIDIEHFNRPLQYGLFSALLWGAHQIHRKWHYHIGVLGYTGMEGEEIYPVIGADYSPNSHWTFLALFPIDYNVQYKPTDRWRLSLKVRPLRERFRTNDHQAHPRSVFNYSTTGAELNVHYEIPLRLEVEIYGGYNFGGNFYIKDADGSNPLYTSVGGAPYGGLVIDWGI